MRERAGKVPANVDVGAIGRAILEAAQGARLGVTVTFVDREKPELVYINEAAAEIVGWPVEELFEHDVLAHVAPEDEPLVHERFRKRAGGEPGERTYPLTVLRKDGRRVNIEVDRELRHDGRPAVVFAFVVDVTARIAAERAKSRTEAQFRALMEIAPEPFGIVREGRFVYANKAYANALGYTDVADLYGIDIRDRLSPEEGEALRTREKFVREGGRLPPTIYHARRRDGTIVQLEASSGPCDFEGKPAIITMARDVSGAKGAGGAARAGRPARRDRHDGGRRRPRDQQPARLPDAQPRLDRAEAPGERARPFERRGAHRAPPRGPPGRRAGRVDRS